MSTESITNTTSPKRTWLKKLIYAAGGLLVLLVITWFVVTSGAFLKGVILPRAGKAMNATLSADAASLSPFSKVSLRGLKLQTTGTEPLLTLGEFRARYSLTAIMGGTLKVDEVLIDSPVVTIIENADGTRNTDALMEGGTTPAQPETQTTGAMPQVDLKQFILKDATVRYIRLHTDGTRDTVEISGMNITLDDVKNGAAGKLAFALNARAELNPPIAAERGTLLAKHEGQYTFTLGPDLFPKEISGRDSTEVTGATGVLSDLSQARMDLAIETSLTEIKQVALSFSRGKAPLGELRISGPFDAMKREGRLYLTLGGIDKKLLNLAGKTAGLDFGPTTVNSTNVIQLTQGGSNIGLSGQFNLSDLAVTRDGLTTPRLQFAAEYALTVDADKRSALLQTLNLSGSQNGQPILNSALSSPMPFAWGNAANTVGDASLTLNLTSLNLADWKSFMSDAVSEGSVSATAKLESQAGGKKLSFDLTSKIESLTVGPLTNRIAGLALNLNTRGTATDFTKVDVTEINFAALHLGQTLATATGSASSDLNTTNTTAKLEARAFLVPILGLIPQTNAPLTGGTVTLNASVNQQGPSQSITGRLAASDLATGSGAKAIHIPTTTTDFNVSMTGQVIDLKQMLLKLAPSDRAKNELTLTGRVDMTHPEAITGGLKLAAESLDLTPYYDLFASVPAGTETPKPTATSDATVEPEPITLPFTNFVCEASIGRVLLREIDITKVLATVKLNGSHVTVNPLQCSLNGAPLSGSTELNLGVPGFQYELAFSADAIPLPPLVNSLQPERKGQISGTLTSSAKLKGAGITGANLKTNLTGQFDLISTNLGLSVGDIRSPVIKSIINVVVAIPDAIRNPGNAVGSLLGSLTGSKSQTNGWMEEFMKSPVNTIIVHGTAGEGKIDLKQAALESAAFRGEVGGTIDIANVLSNSVMHFPVSLSLSKSLSDKAGLTPANTPTNAVYVALPDFVKMGGSLGLPKPDVKYLVLAQLALKSGAGILGNTGSAAGDQVTGALGAIGALFGNKPAANTATTTNAITATNAPATNPANNLIRNIGSLLGTPRTAPSTNTPAATPKP